MHIDLDSEDFILELKIEGQLYKLPDPTENQISNYTEKIKKDSSVSVSAFKELLIELGLPKDKADTLGVFKIKKIMNVLAGELAEKK